MFQNDALFKMWVWCLLKATHRKIFISVRTGRGTTEVELLPGQFVFGRFSAARELRCKPATVADRLLKLKRLGKISIQPGSHYSIISIVNWERYQSDLTSSVTQPGRQPSPNRQASSTNKNKNHIKHNKKREGATPLSLVADVVTYLNQQVGVNFNPGQPTTQDLILQAAADGFSLPDFQAVIDLKVGQWLDDPKMSGLLRPKTLFAPDKFEGYVQEAKRNGSGADIETARAVLRHDGEDVCREYCAKHGLAFDEVRGDQMSGGSL